jgi:hypothetical protein
MYSTFLRQTSSPIRASWLQIILNIILGLTIFLTMQISQAFAGVTKASYDAKSENSSASETRTAIPQSEIEAKKFSDDIDKEVTDIKLRNNSGKKRTYSSSIFVSYSGGSLGDPGSDKRPNVGDSKIPYPVSLSTDIAFRVRLNKNKSIFAATGLYQATPFTDSDAEKAKGKSDELELNTIFLGYNDTFAAEQTQVGSNLRLYFTTQDSRREFGELATAGYSVSAHNQIGKSTLQGALRVDLYYTYYDKGGADLEKYQVDYGLGVVPTLQWNPSDKWNVYTSLNVLRYQHTRSDDFNKLGRAPSTQSLGAGVAIVRDFYLSPYIQFEPEKMSNDRTSVNLSVSMNL